MIFPVYWMVSDRVQDRAEHLQLLTEMVADSRDARRTSGDAITPAVLLAERQEQPDRRRRRCHALPGARVSRGPGAREVSLLRPESVHRDHHRSPDGAAERADHPAVHHAQPRSPSRTSLSGVIVTYMTFVLPFAIWTLRGLHPRRPGVSSRRRRWSTERRRFGAFVRDPLPARRARPGGDVDLRFHSGLERVHHRLRVAQQSREADAHRVARVVHHEPRNGLGRADGRRDPDGACRSSSSSCSCRGELPSA